MHERQGRCCTRSVRCAGQHHGAGQAAAAGAAGGVGRVRRQRQGQGAARVPLRAVRHLQRGRRQEDAVHQPHVQLQDARAGEPLSDRSVIFHLFFTDHYAVGVKCYQYHDCR